MPNELLPDLQKGADRAQAGDMRGLHQVILGPSPSGKTTQAELYAQALVDKGAANGIVTRDASKLDDGDAWSGIALFEGAEGGVLILEKFDQASPAAQGRIASAIAGAIENKRLVVIVTGSGKVEKFLQKEPGVARRLNPPLHLPQLTPEEITHYHRSPGEKAEIARQREAAEKRVAEWRASKTFDLATKAPLKGPQTARFTRKRGGTPDAT